MGFNYKMAQATAIIPKITGSLSIIGSSLIARNVFKRWRGQNSNEHLPASVRAVANMCVADIGSSFWGHFMSTWMMPSTYAYIKPYAAGNSATCTAQAFLYFFFIVVGGWCNAFLAFTYYLTVCRQVSETKLRSRKYKALLLGWPWVFGLVLALINTFVGKGGQVFKYPWACEAWATTEVFYFSMALIGVGLLIILFSMGSLIRVVYLTERKMDRFSQGDDDNRAKTKQVTMQGISYIAAYLVIFVPVMVSTMAGPPQGFTIFYACVYPLQGFLNALVFFRPKYAAVRGKRGGDRRSRVGIVFEVLDASDVSNAFTRLTSRVSARWSSTKELTSRRFSRRSSTERMSSVITDSPISPEDEEHTSQVDA